MNDRYQPDAYQQFRINDPKARVISKASVRDRLLHQAIYQVLYPAFDRIFIFDSYSCRNKKGTHRAFQRLEVFARRVSRNFREPCWAIKMDVKKFFDSIDHGVLLNLLRERIGDPPLLHLLECIIISFEFSTGKAMPLGNLTSQLFANVYMDPLDQFVKRQLKVRHYLRYADDFVILANNPNELLGALAEVNIFLRRQLKLQIHPTKVVLRKLSQGIDFVGYVALPHYSLPRQKTVRRIFRRLKDASLEEIAKPLPSYLGYVGHAIHYTVEARMLKLAQKRLYR